ncbi:hypothetical protein BGZ70_006556 [Mortierella alpina]|uniref:FAD-binding domain-containing protein n=1 Tax=Mortierella alpina TaxID=64518 RepID=A0A9P6J7Z9_MORAP|nr:hypothetical protein BGZ70_006556 [Mortierella alpina]
MAPSIRVLIVGGGIGGLMLGLMLERAGIEYQILERSPEHRPLGSAISMNGTVLRLFEQLGLLEEIYKISKFAGRLNFVKEDKEMQGHVDLEHFRDRYGYPGVLFGRPDLFKVLAAHIPDGKLLMSKRILSTSQTEEGVMVRCSDNSIYHGDILVGADGAYSSVRQCMHKSLKEKGLLSKADSQQLKFDQHCVVGITDPLSAEKYPILRDQTCDVYGIMGSKRPYTVWLIPITGNRFAWSIGGRIPDSEVGQEDVRSFSFAEWWPELATDVCDLVRDYALPDLTTSFRQDERYKNFAYSDDYSNGNHPASDSASVSDNSSLHSAAHTEHTPVSSNSSSYGGENGAIHHPKVNSGVAGHASSILTSSSDPINGHISKHQPPPAKAGTVAEILDATPTDRISKVMLESKLFKVWHHERTVLIGDACHKVLPFAGQGAIQAILDGVALANAIYDMESNSIHDITKAFKKYSNERIPVAKAAVTGSRSMGKLLNVQGRLLDIFRKISFSHAPTWVLRLATDKLHLHRPQLTYLPMVPDRGIAKAHKQDYSAKYLKRLAQDRQAFQRRQNSAAAVAAKAADEAAPEHDKQYRHEQQSHEEQQHHHHSHHQNGHHHAHHSHHDSSREFEDSARQPERSFAAGHSSKHHPRQVHSTRKMSLHSLSLEPPPLPTEAPPRHHPQSHVARDPSSTSSTTQLYDTLNLLSLQIDGYSNGAGDLHSQVSSPPRSPLSFSDSKSIQSNESIISNTSHFRQAPKPLHSVEQERPQYSSEQIASNMTTLRGRRSDSQLNVSRPAPSRQPQEPTHHQDYYDRSQ